MIYILSRQLQWYDHDPFLRYLQLEALRQRNPYRISLVDDYNQIGLKLNPVW